MLLPEFCRDCPDKRTEACPLPTTRRLLSIVALHGAAGALEGIKSMGINGANTISPNPITLLLENVIACADDHQSALDNQESIKFTT